MNYVNIHGQPVTVDFKGMVLAAHPRAFFMAPCDSVLGGNTPFRVYSAPGEPFAIGVGVTEAAAWEVAWRVVEAEAEALAQRDDEHDPDEVY